MFLVKWNDLSEKLVYRRFTEIYEFHVSRPRVGTGTRPSARGLRGGEKEEGEFQLKLPQNKPGSKEAPGSQCFSLLRPSKWGTISSVLPWQISPSVGVRGPASTCQRQWGKCREGGQATGRGVGAAGGSPGAILTAMPVSAPQKALKEMFPIESGDINMENRIIPHLPGEGQVQGWGLKEKWKLVGKFPGGASSAGRLLRSCLVQFLFLPTGLEIKTPERSERRRRFLPTLASPADPVLPPRRRAMSHSIAATPGLALGTLS